MNWLRRKPRYDYSDVSIRTSEDGPKYEPIGFTLGQVTNSHNRIPTTPQYEIDTDEFLPFVHDPAVDGAGAGAIVGIPDPIQPKLTQWERGTIRPGLDPRVPEWYSFYEGSILPNFMIDFHALSPQNAYEILLECCESDVAPVEWVALGRWTINAIRNTDYSGSEELLMQVNGAPTSRTKILSIDCRPYATDLDIRLQIAQVSGIQSVVQFRRGR